MDPLIEKSQSAAKYLQGIMLQMRLSGRIAVTIRDGSIYLEIIGAEPGLVIGHRGQNLDALQHLVNRMVNQNTDEVVPVTVDSDEYRDRRHQQLQRMVRDISQEVADSGQPSITEALTPSERRLFHMAANRVKGIRTSSFGNGFFQPIKVYPIHPQQRRESKSYGNPGRRPPHKHRRHHLFSPDYTYRPDYPEPDNSYNEYE